MLKITSIHNLQQQNFKYICNTEKTHLLSFRQNDEFSSTTKKKTPHNANFINRAFSIIVTMPKKVKRKFNQKLQKNNQTNVKEEKNIAKTDKTVLNVSNQDVIPKFKPTFNVESFENIVSNKNLEITPQWIETHPKDCLTILNAIGYPFVDDSTIYYDISEFKKLIPTTKGQAKIIQTILKQPNLLEVADQRLTKEKAEYINSIWDEYIHIQTGFKPMNKEKNLQGHKQVLNQ